MEYMDLIFVVIKAEKDVFTLNGYDFKIFFFFYHFLLLFLFFRCVLFLLSSYYHKDYFLSSTSYLGFKNFEVELLLVIFKIDRLINKFASNSKKIQ
ncbi:hypothetical protein A2466_01315 [Candidatus Falkowbacteria bacterium RIFOXYC2_FULL_34_220]|nr:MAG: hypothetical protein A2466_01315 [Candidatus Falkowbacteria bacterium RIFOXYC2_FULL_34_220]